MEEILEPNYDRAQVRDTRHPSIGGEDCTAQTQYIIIRNKSIRHYTLLYSILRQSTAIYSTLMHYIQIIK